MTANGFIQIALYCVVVTLLVKPFGFYITRVFNGERTFLSPLLRPVERVMYYVSRVNEHEEQGWLGYGLAVLSFSLTGFLALYALQRLQAVLPFNPQHLDPVSPDLAFNTSVSFVTNTIWQSYVPETTMSYLTQMAGLTMHNFVSAATGIALAIALIRGSRGPRQFRPAWLQRSALCLCFGHRQQWQRLRGPQRQHAVLEYDTWPRHVDRAFFLHRTDARDSGIS